MKMTALLSQYSVCREDIPTASAEKLAHRIELFGKEVEHKGKLIKEKGGEAGTSDRHLHS